MSRFNTFTKSHQDAVWRIKKVLEGEDSPLKRFAVWLFETDENPHGFLPAALADSVNSAEGFSKLLDKFEHEYVSFVQVFSENSKITPKPQIVFAYRDDISVEDVLDGHQKRLVKEHGNKYSLAFLDDFDEFVRAMEMHNNERIEMFFSHFAKNKGVDFAVEHFKDNKHYNSAWAEKYR